MSNVIGCQKTDYSHQIGFFMLALFDRNSIDANGIKYYKKWLILSIKNLFS